MNKRMAMRFVSSLAAGTLVAAGCTARAQPVEPPSPAADSAWTMTVAAVGDMVMGTTCPGMRIPPDSGRGIFASVAATLQAADLTFGNQEGPLTSGGACTKPVGTGKHFAFQVPPFLARRLKEAGFDVVNLANNHINDFGPVGLTETLRTLDALGIKHTGLPGDVAELTVKGRRVAVIGFSTSRGTNSVHDIAAAQHRVAELARQHDLVIVSFHGGSEGARALHVADRAENLFGEPRGNVYRFAHAVVDSGACLVIGHGPHVPRALEVYRDRLIAYSLGNFVAYGGLSCAGECGRSLVLEARLDSTGRFLDGRIVPVTLDPPGFPKPDTTGRSLNLVRALTEEDFPVTGPRIDSLGRLTPR